VWDLPTRSTESSKGVGVRTVRSPGRYQKGLRLRHQRAAVFRALFASRRKEAAIFKKERFDHTDTLIIFKSTIAGAAHRGSSTLLLQLKGCGEMVAIRARLTGDDARRRKCRRAFLHCLRHVIPGLDKPPLFTAGMRRWRCNPIADPFARAGSWIAQRPSRSAFRSHVEVLRDWLK